MCINLYQQLVPWQIAFENDQSTYRSHGRNNARKIASVHEELSAMFEAKWKEKEVALTATNQAQIEANKFPRETSAQNGYAAAAKAHNFHK